MIPVPDPDPTSLAPGAHIWGWMAHDQLFWLFREARTMNSVVEIGCLHGRSSFALLAGCLGPVYCIDPWDDKDNYGYPSFLSHCGQFSNLRAIRGLSPEAGERVPGAIDMCFIDGNHDYEACADDIEYWFPRTRKLMCGHDYNHPEYPGVQKAVKEYFGVLGLSHNLLGGASIWFVRINE